MTFDPIRSRLEVTDSYIQDLQAAIDAFRNEHPWSIWRELHPETGHYIYHVTISGQPDPGFGIVISEVVHHLRSALDNVVYAATLAHHNGKLPERNEIRFPVCQTAKGFRGKWHGLALVPDAVFYAIEYMQPYQPRYRAGGVPDDWPEWQRVNRSPLWMLDRLWNTDKHRFLIPALTNVDFDHTYLISRSEAKVFFYGLEQGPLNDDQIVCYVGPLDPEPDFELSLDIGVGFDKGAPIVPGHPIVNTLRELSYYVREMVIPVFAPLISRARL